MTILFFADLVETPPVSVPPVSVPPVSVPPVSVPPVPVPPVSLPPVSVPPMSVPPVYVPPVSSRVREAESITAAERAEQRRQAFASACSRLSALEYSDCLIGRTSLAAGWLIPGRA